MTAVTPPGSRTAPLDPEHRSTTPGGTASDRLLPLTLAPRNRLHDVDPERGDVPGWVMITLMTAGIVTVIWGVAGPALTDLFNDAITKASTPTTSGGGAKS